MRFLGTEWLEQRLREEEWGDDVYGGRARKFALDLVERLVASGIGWLSCGRGRGARKPRRSPARDRGNALLGGELAEDRHATELLGSARASASRRAWQKRGLPLRRAHSRCRADAPRGAGDESVLAAQPHVADRRPDVWRTGRGRLARSLSGPSRLVDGEWVCAGRTAPDEGCCRSRNQCDATAAP